MSEEQFQDTEGKDHHYYRINTDKMAGGIPVTIFQMGKFSGDYNTVDKYIGYGTEYGSVQVDLTNGVCSVENEITPSEFIRIEDGVEYKYKEEYVNTTDVQGSPCKYYKITKNKGETVSGNFVPSGEDAEIFYMCPDRNFVHYISDSAFENNSGVSTINIRTDNLYRIGNYAFKNCVNLTETHIGTKVQSIGRECFRNCGRMATLNMVDCSSLTQISDGAFAYCAFDHLDMPLISNLTLGAGVFYGCQNLNDSLDPQQGMFKNYYK